MRWTNTFIPTLKEDPQEAEAISHKLMVRAGLIRRVTAGAYIYLPLGYRVLRKAGNIVREEMDRSGASELFMPALQPPELWKKSGRYDIIGDVMIKYRDRHGREMALGPTHEEIVTDLVSREVRSYKDLPLILYQIQTKFRDEVRPRFGVVRSCEFIMKDAYSFDVDVPAMEKSYRKMYDAYCRIFERCGLPYIPVEADPGLMGGTVSHEFMIPADIGEDRIAVCEGCGYAASTEVAAVKSTGNGLPGAGMEMKPVAEADTPGSSSVQDVSRLLKVDPSDIIKTLIYIGDDKPLAVLIRGDHEANDAKIKNYLRLVSLKLADGAEIAEFTGGPMGFSGPCGLSIKIVADLSVKGMVNAVAGANMKDKHLLNVNAGRDFKADAWFDARVITEEDKCPRCGSEIKLKHAIEIGHTFKLGTKYSSALNACFLDESGKERQIIMGCYGIGVNRIIASLIECSYDNDGIIWPVELCPYEVVVIPVKMDDSEIRAESEKIYECLKSSGIEVLYDDREKTAGVKFKDADLIGFPVQIVVGKKGLEQNKFEVKKRSPKESVMVDKDKFLDYVKKLLGKS
ncbi:MAG: proline--tRNA ligase [Candidatus Omnitrophota bacterium]